MADIGPRVVVTGLRDLNKALKAADTEAADAMKASMKSIAEIVVADVQARVPHLTGAARASYKPRGGVKGAGIAFGSARAPYVAFLEFGNKVGAGAGVGRGDTVPRPFVKGGRYLYPAIEANMRDIEQKVGDAIDGILATYGYKTEEA